MEEFSVKVEPASDPQQDPAEEDLFHDMTPVFQKPKKVRTEYIIKLSCGTLQNCSKKVALFFLCLQIVLKKNKGYPDGGYNTRPETTPSRFNFDMSYSPVEVSYTSETFTVMHRTLNNPIFTCFIYRWPIIQCDIQPS